MPRHWTLVDLEGEELAKANALIDALAEAEICWCDEQDVYPAWPHNGGGYEGELTRVYVVHIAHTSGEDLVFANISAVYAYLRATLAKEIAKLEMASPA